jgi:hypothetical protein
MREVIVLCEGQTEKEFCRSVIAPAVASHNVTLSARLGGEPQQRRGGIREWDAYRKEVLKLGRQRMDWHVALLVDYYAMPSSWPGRGSASAKPPDERGRHVEEAIRSDLSIELGTRIVPCVQLHEFESLLFVDPAATAQRLASLATDLRSEQLTAALSAVVTACGGVERIDDSPQTAPSKRIKAIAARYDKVGWGIPAVEAAGLPVLRAGCPWLDRWVSALEQLGEA